MRGNKVSSHKDIEGFEVKHELDALPQKVNVPEPS